MMRSKVSKTAFVLVAIAGSVPGALAQVPMVTVPTGTDLLGEPFRAPGQWPGKVTAANIDNTTAPGGVLNGVGSNYLEHGIASGPVKWTVGASNEGDLDLNIGPFDPSDGRYFPVGNFWQQFRDNCGGLWPVPDQPVAAVPLGACANWGRLNNPASGPITYAWSIQPAIGIVLASVRDNGRDNLNTIGGLPVGTQYATAWVSADDFRGGRGYSMIDGTHRNGLGSMYLSFSSVGISEEIITDVSVGWFPYQQGWIGGYSTSRNLAGYPVAGQWLLGATGPDRVAASPNLPASVVQWSERGRARIELGGDRTPANGMIFTISTQANSNIPVLIGVKGDASGWDLAMRPGDSTDTGGTTFTAARGQNEDSFAFVYVPFNAPQLIGGRVNGATGTNTGFAGTFTLARTAAGQYSLTIPGKTGNDGALFLQVDGALPGNAALPDRTFLTYEYDAAGGLFRIESRELTVGGDIFGEDHPLRDSSFSFVWVDFTNPLMPKCPGDFNGDGSVSVQDIFDFLAGYFSNNILADVTGDGTVSVQDIFDFLAAYFRGC